LFRLLLLSALLLKLLRMLLLRLGWAGLLLFLLSAFFAPLRIYRHHGAEKHENPDGPGYFHECHVN
jgi:hypothetical protein